MNNPLHDSIRQIMKPELQKIPPSVKARVLSYDADHREANIELRDWRGNNQMLKFNNVPVQLGGVGIHMAGPFPGDTVWVEFHGFNIANPRIMGLLDEVFNAVTREHRWSHQNQGAYLPDIITEG